MSELSASLKALEAPLDRVVKKQKVCYSKTVQHIDQILQKINETKASLEETENSTNLEDEMKKLLKGIEESKANQSIANEYKDYFSTISKFGKSFEKMFIEDITRSYDREIKFDEENLNKLIAEHFYREGELSVGESFSKQESKVLLESKSEDFETLFKILNNLREKKLDLVSDWVKEKRSQLVLLEKKGKSQDKMEIDGDNNETKSQLEFKICRLNYVKLLSTHPDQAVHFARSNFNHFAENNLKEIQRLMGCILYIDKLQSSPYSSYFENDSSKLWTEIESDFTRWFCKLAGLTRIDPLFYLIAAGGLAIPKKIKFSIISDALGEQKKNIKSQALELDLGSQLQFHSIFSCPVSREETSPDNPPMRLICGHVVSNASLFKLAKGGSKLKCPICPTEQVISKATEVNF